MVNNIKMEYTLSLLLEMNQKAQKLVELMKQGVVKFVYTKMSTGRPRTAYGTCNRDLIPPQFRKKRGRPRRRRPYLVVYYDVKKHAIRSFKDELLQKVYPLKSKNKIDDTTSTDNKKEEKK